VLADASYRPSRRRRRCTAVIPLSARTTNCGGSDEGKANGPTREVAIVRASRNRSIPSGPCRRPRPESPTPPIGVPVADHPATNPSLIQTVPHPICRATARPRSRSAVQTLAFSPYGESLARSMAAAVSRTGVTETTGPNVSSQAMRSVGSTSVSTVGSYQHGPISGRGRPPVRTVAPSLFASVTNWSTRSR